MRACVVLVAFTVAGCSCAESHEATDGGIDVAVVGAADVGVDATRDARADATTVDAPSPDAVSPSDAAAPDAPDACVAQQPGSWVAPPPDPNCPANEWTCVACARLEDDPMNCGACGVRCCGGWCFSGVCGAEGPAGTTVCGWSCGPSCVGPTPHDLSTDPSNCGMCGHACPAGQRCVTGICQ